MITLSEEQRRKIEENKAAAILKKQQADQKQKSSSSSSSSSSSTSTSLNLNEAQIPAWKKYARKTYDKSPIKVFHSRKDLSPFISASCKVYGENRFLVEMPYLGSSIEVFKSIPGRKYEADLKKWSFPLTEQPTLISKLKKTCPEVVVNSIPNSVLLALTEPDSNESVGVNWSKIDRTLRDYLMPFQVEGVKFGIQMKGRCMIADDMGLGKTIQALGIVHYFSDNWPLLIVCPSSMKFQWKEAIKTFLPSVQLQVQVLTSGRGQSVDGEIVIVSYDLMKNCFDDLISKKFGVIVFDESHLLKSCRAIRTKVALKLSSKARNIILLSGTPALSRPEELYCQIFALDPFAFKSMYEFGLRYCNGKKEKYGWNFSGSSNLEELEMYLKKKIMIRRLKSEVIQQLPSKMRKLVILHPTMVKEVTKQMKKLESNFHSEKGAQKHSTLLSYYSMTGKAKLKAACEYIEEKLEKENKLLVFAHHVFVMNGICDLLVEKKVDHIRIDGSVSSELRKAYCDKFQSEDTCRVAVLSITAANCGITLTAAQLVVFAELYWNPGILTQAEDRAHRIGQKDCVFVEYLVAKGTADDHLWKLIEEKLNVLNRAGLSKDDFKNTDTELMEDPNQLKITCLLHKNNQTSDCLGPPKLDEFFGEAEDDVFNSINLEEIETEYQINNKKRKTSEM